MSCEMREGAQWSAAPATRGVLYVATGGIFLEAALRSARSVRQNSPELSIHLFTSKEGSESISRQAADLDIGIGVIEVPHRRSKVDYVGRTPFEHTLYLDSDTIVCTAIDDVFDVLERFDIALAHAHLREHRNKKQIWCLELPDSFPQFNAGVIAFRRTPSVMELLEDWGRFYHSEDFKKDQVTLRELLWKSDLQIATLPPEYNLRFEKYLRDWYIDEARPRILHLHRFHQEPSFLERLLGRRQLLSMRRWYGRTFGPVR